MSTTPGCSGTQNTLDARQTLRPSVSHQLREGDNVFRFTVPWDSLPHDVITRLDENEKSKTLAFQSDRNELKLSKAKKLVSEFNDFKETHPGQNKHPGKVIYESVKFQVR